MKSLQLAIYNLQFILDDQFTIFNAAAIRKCEMSNVKLMLNGKRKMINASGGGL